MKKRLIRVTAEMRRLADIGDVTGVLRVLSSAVKCGVKLDIIVYTVALSACAKRGKWREAADLMQALRREGLKPDAHVYSSLMSCYTRGGQWSSALAVLESVNVVVQSVSRIIEELQWHSSACCTR
eukprot:4806-Heterococcus_DN1.PRE.1